LIAWCFQAQLPGIRRQQDLIADVMRAVHHERSARGLDG
jgi:hypothetical protein